MRILSVVPILALVAATASAQEKWREPSGEVRPFAGMFLPVGASREDFKRAATVGAQVAVEANRYWHGVASLAYTPAHNKFFDRDRTEIWQYDVGAELNAVHDMGWGWFFRPFIGAGAGGRSYNYRQAAAETTHCLAGYGAAGAELQYSVLAFRAEARDYLACYESPITGKKRTRNDVGLTFGFAYHLR